MSNNVSINFRVSGSELSNYIDSIKKKSADLTESQIKGAIEQSTRGREQIKIIDEQIKALERKNKIEAQAGRSIGLDRREYNLSANKDKYEGKKESVFADKSLSESEKKERIIALSGAEKSGELDIKNNYRENLTVLKEQERQNKIQTNLAKENIDAIKETAQKNIKAIQAGDIKLVDVISSASTNEQKLAAKLTEEGLKEEVKSNKKESVIGSILAVDNINKLMSASGQFAQSQNGFDLIQPASNMAGRIIGGVLGGAVGALAGGVGAIAGAGVGASVGGGIGDTVGGFEQREALTKENYLKTRNRYSAVTGNTSEQLAPDMSESGSSVIQFLQTQTEFAKRLGTSKNSGNVARDAIYAEKGFGVDQGTSNALVEMQRSSRESNRDLAELIGGVIEKGKGTQFKNGDNTFLNEFLGKFLSLQKEFLKNQTHVATGTTMDILNRFTKMGGEFDAKDSRSESNISAIQSGLTDPASDNMKAMSFGVLRKEMPNASTFEILQERQKGLASPKYLKGMLGMLDQLGGDESQKKLNLSGMFPGLSLSAVSRMYDNKSSLISGKVSVDELKSKYPKDFKEKSDANTTTLEKGNASVTNGLLSGQGVEAMAKAFDAAVRAMLGGAVIEMKDGNSIKLMSGGQVKTSNATYKANQDAMQKTIDSKSLTSNPDKIFYK